MSFHARQRGERPAAVFLHGFGGDLHTWDAVWAELGDALPVLRYDLRGFGASSAPVDMPFRHADDLLAILDTVGIEQADLVGVSMGGAVALNLALDHPRRVRKLVLISPALVAWEWSEHWRELWRPIVAAATVGAMDEARRLWWQHPLFATTRSSAGAGSLFESIMRFAGTQWVRDEQRRALPDVERLHQLDSPTLLLTGGADLDDFRLIAALIEASAAHVRRIDLPQCGHLLQLEEPATCARHIVSFLHEASARLA